jgi:predicted FMN-binding regulatory protein PaiB
MLKPEIPLNLVEVGSSPFGKALRAIVGVRMKLQEVQVKFKFWGNRTPEHRLQIAHQLARRGRPNELAAVEHLLRRTQPSQRGGAA